MPLPLRAVRKGNLAYWENIQRRGVVVFENVNPPDFHPMWQEKCVCKSEAELNALFPYDSMSDEESQSLAYFWHDLDELK